MKIVSLKTQLMCVISILGFSSLTACANNTESSQVAADAPGKTVEPVPLKPNTYKGETVAQIKIKPTGNAPTKEQSERRARQLQLLKDNGMPTKQIMIRPGGPVNKPVPGLGPDWQKLDSMKMAGQWSITSEQSGERYDLTLLPKRLSGVGEARFSGQSPFTRNRKFFWRVDKNGNFYLLDRNYQSIWRAGRVDQKTFQGVIDGPNVFKLTPSMP